MIAIKRGCLNQAELERVLAGQLPQDDFDSAISHLDDCETCRSAADAMQQSGSWLVESLADNQADPLQAETACQVALWRMLETPIATPAGFGATIPRDQLGPYRLLQALGVGGMGTVYLAEHQRLKRQCAIKLLPRERVDQPGWLDRFDREMTTIASLEHPNVVRASDAGHEDGWHYLVMEYLDGLDVGRIASRMGQLEVNDACEIIRQAALGLAHVHNSGLVHRDVKPSNLMLTRSGVVKILDLGLVLAGDDPLGIDDRLTTVGHMMGTMPYMAPEQLADSHEVDPRADIYSLGATLYRLIAGRPPHERRGGLASQVLAITHQDPPALDAIRADVNRDVVKLVTEMLSRDPAARPDSADDVAQRLASLGTDSRLKALLREALRRPAADPSQPASLLPTVSVGSSPPTTRLGRRLIGGMFAALVLFAAFLIKIQTDKGNLIIHSEYDGLTIVIKQGSEEVDRLTVDSTNDNKTVLYKGTYRVEIEGGGEALALSDQVVTIARGADSQVRVVEKPKLTKDVKQLTQQSQPAATPKFRGHDLDEWIDILEQEIDVDAIGEAMGAAISLCGKWDRADSANCNRVATTILNRAREFGGWSIKTPPPRNSHGFEITPAEHFMWYVAETFSSLPLEATVAPLNKELEAGNGRSRAAVLRILAKYDWQQTLRLLDDVDGRLQLSQMLRNAAGLTARGVRTESWAGLPETDAEVAIQRAYGLAVRLAIIRGVDPFTIPPIAVMFQSRDRDDWSPDEWLIHFQQTGDPAAIPQIQTMIRTPVGYGRGTAPGINAVLAKAYAAAYEKWENQLQEAEQPIDGGVQQDVADPSRIAETAGLAEGETGDALLFQGKDLQAWMALLSREQDAVALGNVLQAVEVLTRDTDQRLRAATETFKTARRWGGMASSAPRSDALGSSGEDPSFYYMHFFLRDCHGYLPEPGVAAIAEELVNGNTRSRMACIWLLKNYLGNVFGDVYFGQRVPRGRIGADAWVKETMQTEEGVLLLDKLESALQLAVTKLPSGDAMARLAAENAIHAAINLRLLRGKTIGSAPWLESYVTDRVAKANAIWAGKPPANDGSWMMEEDLLVAATQLASARGEGNWELLAAMILDGRFPVYRRSVRANGVIETLAEKAPELLLKQIESRLTALLDPGSADEQGGQSGVFGNAAGGFGTGIAGGGGTWNPLFVLASEQSVWTSALPFYARQAKSVPEALDLLAKLRQRMEPIAGENVWGSKQPFANIDAAIKTLQERK